MTLAYPKPVFQIAFTQTDDPPGRDAVWHTVDPNTYPFTKVNVPFAWYRWIRPATTTNTDPNGSKEETDGT